MDQSKKGTFDIRQTLHKLQKSQLVCEYKKRKLDIFDYITKKKFGISMSYLDNIIPKNYTPNEDSEEAPPQLSDDSDPVESDGTT